MNNDFYTAIILVGRNTENDVLALCVDYNKYGFGYDWLADIDVDKLQLKEFPFILDYLCHSSDKLELKYQGDEMISAEIVSMQREGGYKEPFQRIVKYSHSGFGCLDKLERQLSMQIQSDYQDNDSSKSLLVKTKSISKK